MSASSAPRFRLVRAGWVLVREGVVAALPGDELAGLPKFGWRVGAAVRPPPRARRRPQRPAGRGGRRGSGRPMSSSASSWRRGPMSSATTSRSTSRMLQDRMATFPTAEADGRDRRLARPPGRRALCRASASRSPPPRSPRCIRPKSMRDGVATKVAVKVIRPGVRQRFSHDLESYFLAARLQERYHPVDAPAAAGRGDEDAGADHQDRDGSAAGGGRAFRARREHRATIPASACRRSTGSAPAATC